jgi:hypothetical protein
MEYFAETTDLLKENLWYQKVKENRKSKARKYNGQKKNEGKQRSIKYYTES